MELVCQVLSFPCMIYFAYYIITALFFLKNGKNSVKKQKSQKRFAVVIAARNEGSVIANLIYSLKKQRYPSNLYEIFVAPNNCTDNTEEVARNSGATIIDVTVPTRTKGQVLNFVFDKLVYHTEYGIFDGYVVFDADNIVHPNFLARMNDALCANHKAVQAFRDSKNPKDTWISGSHSIFCWIQNLLFNGARKQLNLSAAISGTGFMISHDLLYKTGFNPVTMSEDTELTVKCLLNGEKIWYEKEAVFYDEQCTDLKTSIKQRTRWSTGTYQCLGLYGLQLIVDSIKNKRYVSFDVFVYLLGPLMQAAGLINLLLLALCNIWDLKVYTVMGIILCFDIFGMIASYFVSIALTVMVTMFSKKKLKNVWKGIVFFPIFMVTWLPINVICIFRKVKTWEPIAHTKDIAIESMLEYSKEEKIS